MRTDTSSEYSYSMVFLLRRLIYSVITVTCLNNPNICIHVFLLTNVLYTVYLGYSRPHDTPMSRKIEFFNEAGQQLCTYHLCLFPLVISLDDEYHFGTSMIYVTGGILAINLLIIMYVSCGAVRRKLYLRGLKKKHEKRMKEFEERRLEKELLRKAEAKAKIESQMMPIPTVTFISPLAPIEEDSAEAEGSNRQPPPKSYR